MAAIRAAGGRWAPGSASAKLVAISSAADELSPDPTGIVESSTPRKPRRGKPASRIAHAVPAA